MIRRIALGSLAATVLAGLALALGPQDGGKKRPKPQDPWAEEKKDPKFADVDWNAKPDPPQLLINSVKGNGPDLYSRYCVQCHGETGDGKGELAPMLLPPPRDFTRGIFKGRSSHPELPPTSTDLMRSMIHGIPLSGMLSYSFIGTPEQVALIGQLQDLAKGHFPKGFGFPLKSGNFHRDAGMPFPTPETIARGRALFERFNCVACHGEKGDGKGRVSDTLVDTVVVHDGMEFERPSSVRDFTQGVYSGGPNVRHMYLRVSGGVQGTVMPPFATSVAVEDRWALTHYVMSLSERSKPLPLPHSEVMIAKRAAKLPAGPDDPAWAALAKEPLPRREDSPFGYGIQPVYVLDLYFHQLRHDRNRPYFIEATARAIHDGTSIAVRLEWEDAASGPGDRIEFQLSPNKHPNPPGFVLYGSERDPVNVWRWDVKNPAVVRSSAEYLVDLARWYRWAQSEGAGAGFVQLGGGIAGDFAICVVPFLRQDLGEDAACWRYFCQVSDSTTSYGSYSGAGATEKISWGKLDPESDYHVIESDATIVAPLLYAIPVQLLAYHTAVLKGTDVDQPRNLAKSVTVE